MKSNSPNPVDGDVQALIADCRAEIDALIALIERLKKHNVQFDLSKYESQLKRQQVAFAALTAQPAQLLRPVELPAKVSCEGFDTQEADEARGKGQCEGYNSALDACAEALRQQGYEVKE